MHIAYQLTAEQRKWFEKNIRRYPAEFAKAHTLLMILYDSATQGGREADELFAIVGLGRDNGHKITGGDFNIRGGGYGAVVPLRQADYTVINSQHPLTLDDKDFEAIKKIILHTNNAVSPEIEFLRRMLS